MNVGHPHQYDEFCIITKYIIIKSFCSYLFDLGGEITNQTE